MGSLPGDPVQSHVDAAIREILAKYENGVGSFRHAAVDAAEALATELTAAIETLPQAELRERLLAEVHQQLMRPLLVRVDRERSHES
jgi:hypothetical protein